MAWQMKNVLDFAAIDISTVEKHIPIPHCRNKRIYNTQFPFTKMQVGDSFTVSRLSVQDTDFYNRINYLVRKEALHCDITICLKTEEYLSKYKSSKSAKLIRVWRTS
jgi:hypothetical protein